MDIKPPMKQRPTVPNPVRTKQDVETVSNAQPINLSEDRAPFSINSKNNSAKTEMPRRKFSMVQRIILGVVLCIVLIVAGALGWYKWAISPVSATENWQTFVVQSGETPSVIARHLAEARLVRNAVAFEVYAKAHGHANSLQAGTYKLSPSQSVASIIGELVKGHNAVYNILIPPGLTLKQLADPTVKGSFAAQGFSAEEINQAFNATYTSALLKDKPVGASLEGYIFPETFQVKEGDSLESVLERSFNTLYGRLESDGMIEKFTLKGFTIHQALTLGSIIQEETSDATVQRQVAQVFLRRLDLGMQLGSDVTFVYAARQLGVEAVATLDSPYNTRIHTGLPPGPIATMNYSALQSVVNPAEGDYLFFVAGDDGTVHFSRTNEEHDRQVQQYCQKLCTAVVQ